jgi:hypothetical protein
VLARVAADTPHDRKLPPIVGAAVGLSLNVGLCGPPGAGKSCTARIAVELVPARVLKPECDGVPPGSGEGLIELLFEQVEEEQPNGKTRPVKRQTRHNAYVYLDEGELLASQTRRTSGSTSYLPTLRAIFTDATIGQANASEDRRRIVRQGQYVIGTVTGFQPERTEPLFADAGAGTPQRFLWAATDTAVPAPAERPDWPGPLKRPAEPRPTWTDDFAVYFDIADSVRERVMERDWQRQQHGCNALDEHADLLQLKIAAILAVLDSRYEIAEDDWDLAGMVRAASDATRATAQAAVAAEQTKREEASRGRQARAAVASVEAVNRQQVTVAARRIAERVWAEPDGVTSTALRRALTKPDREVLSEAIARAVAAGWIVEEREASHTGSDKRTLRPGKERP